MVPVVNQKPAEPSPGTGSPKPQRADARRNRERVLEAAEALFAEDGLKVQIEQVAQRAGVGVGTVCRNFPTKQSLVDAVMGVMCESLLTEARAALDDPDPAAGLRRFFSAKSDYQSRHLALAGALAGDVPSPAAAVKDSLRGVLAQLIERAQANGAIRADIGPGDLAVLLSGVSQAAAAAGVSGADGRSAGQVGPALYQRFLTIVLDGLRPAAPSELPGEPLNVEQAHKSH
ncbi:MAG TPA: TetR/AcrR family transcriptional regulator [Actinomycetota bacterium]|nr:TetR/AcrR family transcriptional regulator [Actinomycetota bacterium]